MDGWRFLTGTRDPDDHRLTPAAVRTFQRRTHHVDVTDAFKGMVDTPFVDIQQDIFNRFVVVIRVNTVGSTEATRQIEFLRVRIDSDNPSRFRLTRA